MSPHGVPHWSMQSDLLFICVFIIYGMKFWHWLKEVTSLWFCHVLFFFSTLVYKKMLSFLNLAWLWKIDSAVERERNRKASLSVIWPLCMTAASLHPILVLNAALQQPSSGTDCSAACEHTLKLDSLTAASSCLWRGDSAACALCL